MTGINDISPEILHRIARIGSSQLQLHPNERKRFLLEFCLVAAGWTHPGQCELWRDLRFEFGVTRDDGPKLFAAREGRKRGLATKSLSLKGISTQDVGVLVASSHGIRTLQLDNCEVALELFRSGSLSGKLERLVRRRKVHLLTASSLVRPNDSGLKELHLYDFNIITPAISARHVTLSPLLQLDHLTIVNPRRPLPHEAIASFLSPSVPSLQYHYSPHIDDPGSSDDHLQLPLVLAPHLSTLDLNTLSVYEPMHPSQLRELFRNCTKLVGLRCALDHLGELESLPRRLESLSLYVRGGNSNFGEVTDSLGKKGLHCLNGLKELILEEVESEQWKWGEIEGLKKACEMGKIGLTLRRLREAERDTVLVPVTRDGVGGVDSVSTSRLGSFEQT